MSGSERKLLLTIAIIIGALFALTLTGITIIYFFGEKSLDPMLEESVRSEYSVPVDVSIINTSEGNVAFISPGEVRWDSAHKGLIYNLSNPKEATLAIIEILSKRDTQAIGFLLSPGSKEYWDSEGYDETQILEALRSNHKNLDKPYAFNFGTETDLSNGMASIIIKQSSDEMEFELHKQPDGTWKI
jgi:hypothetical protein